LKAQALLYKPGPDIFLRYATFCQDDPFRPGPLSGAGHLPQGEGFLIRVPNIICGKIFIPSLLGKVDFAL